MLMRQGVIVSVAGLLFVSTARAAGDDGAGDLCHSSTARASKAGGYRPAMADTGKLRAA